MNDLVDPWFKIQQVTFSKTPKDILSRIFFLLPHLDMYTFLSIIDVFLFYFC